MGVSWHFLRLAGLKESLLAGILKAKGGVGYLHYARQCSGFILCSGSLLMILRGLGRGST